MKEHSPLLDKGKDDDESERHFCHRKLKTCRSKTWIILHYRSSVRNRTGIEKLSRSIEFCILLIILLNVIVVVLSSWNVVNDKVEDFSEDLWYIRFLLFSTVVFTTEYLLRLWSCVEDSRFTHCFFGRLKWLFSPMAFLDLIALVPFYLEIFFNVIPSTSPVTSFRGILSFRALRLLRIISFLRIERQYSSLKKFKRILSRRKEEFIIVVYVTTVVILVSATTIFFLEYEAQPNVFSDISVGLWWSIVTITSIGYGDVVPVTGAGRFFAAIVALIGIILFSVPGAVFGSGFIEVMLEHQQKQETNSRKKILQTIHKEISKTSIHTAPEELDKISLQTISSHSVHFLNDDVKILYENQNAIKLQLKMQNDQLNRIIRLLEHLDQEKKL